MQARLVVSVLFMLTSEGGAYRKADIENATVEIKEHGVSNLMSVTAGRRRRRTCDPTAVHGQLNTATNERRAQMAYGTEHVPEDCHAMCTGGDASCKYSSFDNADGGTCRLYNCDPRDNFEDTEGTQKVLIVIDMQEDYRNQDGIKEALDEINWLKSRKKIQKDASVPFFDLIVYTHDWLHPKYGFATRHTKGAALMAEIAPKKGENVLLFSKDTDDAMTILNSSTALATVGKSDKIGAKVKEYHFDGFHANTKVSFDKERHYSVDPDFEGHGHEPSPLPARLAEKGFLPANTVLYVTGTQQNRCVMKTAMHAKQWGWEVVIPSQAVAGGDQDKWKIKECEEGPGRCSYSGMFEVPGPSCNWYNFGCTEEELKIWREAIYNGYHGGPSKEDYFHYLATAGVRVETRHR